MANASVAQSAPAHTLLPAIVAYNMTPAELEALAEEIMQDDAMSEADAYCEAICEFPRLYLYAKDWDVDALFDGNTDAGFLPF